MRATRPSGGWAPARCPEALRAAARGAVALRDSLLDLLAPGRCAACGAGAREVLCAPCRASCRLPEGPACLRCGAPWVASTPGDATVVRCGRCRRWGGRFAFRSACGLYRYRGPARRLVHAIKYRGCREGALAAGRWMAADPRCAAPVLGTRGPLVVPVPARRASLRVRGYDQAVVLALAFARALHADVEPGALVRRSETGPQAGRGWRARRRAVAGAFRGRSMRVLGRSVVLVDDVLSTGATADACGRALLAAGARAVDLVAFAT